MFVGHYAVALGAKAAEPKAPLWALVAGCQLVDIGWSAFIMTGVEHARVDRSLTGFPGDLYDMPYTHSLPGALAWSVGALLLARGLLRLDWRASAVIGAVVFSHWPLDLIVHRPDLLLWPGGPKVGLGLWNYPAVEEVVELGLLAVLGATWTASRVSLGRTAWPAVALIAFFVTLHLVALLSPPEPGASVVAMGGSTLAIYLVATAVAALADRRGSRIGASAPLAGQR
jgi:hypothetical protein